MAPLFLALLTCALAMVGGRPARLTAHVAGVLRESAELLVLNWLAAIVTSALAAWAGALLAPLMAPAAKVALVALALALAAFELLFTRERALPAEPTRSLGAIALVLFATQLTDAARLFVVAVAVASGAPLFAAIGGALGSGAVLTAACALGREWDARLPLRALRLGAGGVFGLGALVVAPLARGLLG